VLESATWRANPDWAAKLGYSSAALGGRCGTDHCHIAAISAACVERRAARGLRRSPHSRRGPGRAHSLPDFVAL
jgi:hypothetical protein